MATVMSMHWPNVTSEQYDQTRKEVNWEGDVPEGARFHVAWVGEDGLHVLDVWDSQQHFEAFAQQRLMPGVQKVGLQGEPHVEFSESHAIFAPYV